jgi:hypothetical protein
MLSRQYDKNVTPLEKIKFRPSKSLMAPPKTEKAIKWTISKY